MRSALTLALLLAMSCALLLLGRPQDATAADRDTASASATQQPRCSRGNRNRHNRRSRGRQRRGDRQRRARGASRSGDDRRRSASRRRRQSRNRRRCRRTVAAPAPAPAPPAPAPAPAPPPPPPPGNGLFSPTSPWNSRLDPAAALDPRSQTRIAALTYTLRASAARNKPSVVNVGTYSTPMYVVDQSVPRVAVKLDHAHGTSLRRALSSVPIPAGATAARGSDAHMTVYQPSTDTLWELWRAVRKADGWHASWGGAIHGVSTNPGYYAPGVWPGAASTEVWAWGSTASSLPLAAGLVTAADLRAGVIDHTLAAAVPDTCRTVFVWPAQRTDGTNARADCLPMGARLRLDPALNVEALPISPFARMIARAAQQYGIVVRDATHSNLTFFAEDPATASAAVYSPTGPVGEVGYKSLAGFPWERLQVLAARHCTARPCSR